ncbi:YaeQ family protein, partial [Oleiphilus sp. HI0080]
ELGKPDAKRLKKAIGRSKKVTVFSYGGQDVEQWLESIKKDASIRHGITAFRIDKEPLEQLAGMAERTMQIGMMIQDDLVHVSFGSEMIEFKLYNLLDRA